MEEMRGFSPETLKESPGGIYFTGTLETALRACLWSRTASRIYMTIATFPAATQEELYQGCREIAWNDHMTESCTFAVSASVHSSAINHSNFAALKVKDAIADHFRESAGSRPSVQTERPDLQFNIFINKDIASLSIDLSGESLHRREYRTDTVSAPMKENLAASILLYSRWAKIAENGGIFADLMCGSGTFPIEAALIAGDIAPGLLREFFGFNKWQKHDPELWNALRLEAEERKREGLKKMPQIYGFDRDKSAVQASLQNAMNAGLENYIHFEKKDISSSFSLGEKKGLVAMNPPYGERLGKFSDLNKLYEEIGNRLRTDFLGWNGAVFTGNPEMGSKIRLRPWKVRTLHNGPIECKLLHFEIKTESFYREDKGLPEPPLSPGGEMFANRLRKNIKILGKWARKNNIACYRIYDADMPQYAIAVDLYENRLHIQEYAAPVSIDEKSAKKRLRESLSVIPEILSVSEENVFFKIRRKQKGKDQYNPMDSRGEFYTVQEDGAKFLINLTDYLDTGLFLDHRITRSTIREMAKGKSFLNLFAYTGTASVQAAKGGASSVTTVDMSAVYLDWAKRNMSINGFSGNRYQFIQADCLNWITSCKNRYDLIFLDPPTFSNSKRMEGTFDLQRDHVDLIRNTVKLLSKGGTLLFSNNFRNFKMDIHSLSNLKIQDITKQTIPKDFENNPKIHNCWLITLNN